MIGLVNTGACNLASFGLALERLNYSFIVVSRPQDLISCERIVLPGVGSFGAAANNLKKLDLVSAIRDRVSKHKVPILGVCLGMQLLFGVSEEAENVDGIGLLDGKVCRLTDENVARIPNIGWNYVDARAGSTLFSGLNVNDHFYFSHSLYCQPENQSVASAFIGGGRICCAVEAGHIFGVQFHPEKSHKAGLNLIRNFLKYNLER